MRDAGVVNRSVALLAATGIVLMAAAAAAQQPPPKGDPKAQPKVQPKGGQKAAPEPPKANALPQIAYSNWVKVCQKGPEANSVRVCLTGRDGRVEGGSVVVAAVLIEPEGQPRKLLRITLPLGMALKPGTRIIVDDGQPINAPYVICLSNGCVADYEASDELIGKMKRGSNLNVQGINGTGQPVTLPVPLAEFAKAHDGPSTDPAQLNKK
jgi:invasion protein IalB